MISFVEPVKLQAIEPEHLPKMRRWRNLPEIYNWSRQNDLITDAGQKEWYDRQRVDSSIKMFAICDEIDFLGVCGLSSIDLANGKAEFSIYIDPAKHGRGLGKAALATLFHYGFDWLNLHLIFGETFDGNPALQLFERFGLQIDGTLRQRYFKQGRFVDVHVTSMTRDEWTSLRFRYR